MRASLGLDVGSVTTKVALLSWDNELLASAYRRTGGDPVGAVRDCLKSIDDAAADAKISAAGTTGSGRQLAGRLIGADSMRNEITCHAVAAGLFEPDVRTVIEIGGQDSKIILLREGVAIDFAMNTVCAAGTGSFLDHQAGRLGVSIEEFGDRAARAKSPVRIAGRCTVFAESDMIHKQQMGHSKDDIIAGLCRSLVRNYLGNVAKGKDIQAPVVFQGGVAANSGIKAAFEEALGLKVRVPEHYAIMGAIGAAVLAREAVAASGVQTAYRGATTLVNEHSACSFECEHCPNGCEVVTLNEAGVPFARWGGRCGRWELARDTVSAS